MTDVLARSVAAPALQVQGVSVHYGHVEVLHGLSLTLERGVLAIVGRNGMGKTTLCRTVMGLVRPSRGRIFAYNTEIGALPTHRIVREGVAYVPQGRRVWPSLTVDEHLRLALIGDKASAWTVERVYDAFPRLTERRGSFGAQLSGGEQQMLAIGRALLANPRLLVMDEPTEGLAPVIVEQVSAMLKRLAEEGALSILLIEQNLGVALEVAQDVAIMVNGRIAREMPARALAADSGLQLRLLGVGRDEDEVAEAAAPPPAEVRYIQISRAHGGDNTASHTFANGARPAYSASAIPNRWSADNPLPPAVPAVPPRIERETPAVPEVSAIPVAAMTGRSAYIAGTFDTKRSELTFLVHCLKRLGLKTVTVDLSTSGRPSPADIAPAEVARHHPQGEAVVFSKDRGAAVTAMAEAFARFIRTRRDVGGLISAGGSGGTALATTGMRALPIGIPKVMVSTVASGDVGRYVGPSDIVMMYSVTDVQGINSISEQVFSNAAHALAGMIAHQRREGQRASSKPAIGLTMFGLTTPCVQAATAALGADYDCIVFHATGTGGQSMEKLVDSQLLTGVIDATTTEIADFIVGGVFSAGPDRLGAMARTTLPYVGSCGALDMVNFHARETVPQRFSGRRLHVHNPNVTLMRTTSEENEAMGLFIADRLNRMRSPVRFLIPEGGFSGIDAPGQPFHDPAANRALIDTIERMFVPGTDKRLIKLPYHINDPAFAAALVKSFREIAARAGQETSKGMAWHA